MFEVDPFWPKPLPNHWVIANTIGVWADDQDHIWTIHRGGDSLDDDSYHAGLEMKPPFGSCCQGAPAVLKTDPEGNLLRHGAESLAVRVTNGWTTSTASPSTTKEMCGSAAGRARILR